eukprot:Transcript_8315.p1 GENE.Transcript_8315~~Transcript_8315.p1  ORF type:complete len:305 (-),score=77.75 Transcript_8315:128-1042(-)
MPSNASGPWDYFLSHVQKESGRTVALICADLEKKGKKVWLDVNMDNCSETAMMEGVDNSNNFVLVLSPGYFESSYCKAEVNRALQSGKNIILCHNEGINVGAALKAKPPEWESIGSETSIQLVVSDVAFRKVAVDKILSQGLSLASLSLGGPQSAVLKSAKAPDKCMHLASGTRATSNGDQVHLWDMMPGEFPAQEWVLQQIGGGKVLIKSAKAPGKCMHLASGTRATSNGDQVHLWDMMPGEFPAQEWVLQQIGGGKVLIKSAKAPDKCMHLASGTRATSNGDQVHLWDMMPGEFPAQEWLIA